MCTHETLVEMCDRAGRCLKLSREMIDFCSPALSPRERDRLEERQAAVKLRHAVTARVLRDDPHTQAQ